MSNRSEGDRSERQHCSVQVCTDVYNHKEATGRMEEVSTDELDKSGTSGLPEYIRFKLDEIC